MASKIHNDGKQQQGEQDNEGLQQLIDDKEHDLNGDLSNDHDDDKKLHASMDTEIPTKKLVIYLFLAALAQLVQGTYPGLLRFVQVHSGLGSFTVLFTSAAINTIVVGIPLAYKYKCDIRKLFAVPRFYQWFIIINACSIFIVYATRFTFSIFVQLIALLTPFLVAIFCRIFLRQGFPPYTIPAMVVSTVGAFLTLFGDLLDTDEQLSFTKDDWIGILFALLFTFFSASYFFFVQSIREQFDIYVLIWTSFAILIPHVAIAVPLEDWTAFLRMSALDWSMFWTFTIVCLLGSQLLQLATIKVLGSPLVTTLLPLRLVAAMSLGLSPLLNETLHTLNFIGAAIVIVTLGLYMFSQFWFKRQQERSEAAMAQLSIQIHTKKRER